jgi:hypothetical protein
MNQIVPFHGTAVATAGRLDVRAMMKHYTAPYSAAVPFQDLIETVRRNSTPARRSRNQRPSAAIEIHNAVAGHIDAVSKAVESLSVVLLVPDEADVRKGCGTRLKPKPGDCCVFCSYGSVPCPPIQAERADENAAPSCCNK